MKRMISCFLLLATLLGLCLPIAADEAQESQYSSQVMRELESMTVDGEAFSFAAYPANKNDTNVYMIGLHELGYSSSGNYDDYALVLYLYNPSGRVFDWDSTKNKIELAVEWDSEGLPTKYDKFTTRLGSVSDDAGYENRFIKLFVTNSIGLYKKTLISYVANKNERKYAISGIELLPALKSNAEDFTVATTYVCSGFLDTNTYTVAEDDLHVLTLEPKQTYWRSPSSNLGEDWRWQVNACYFSVPDSVTEQYDKLKYIDAAWFESRTNVVLVTDDENFYNSILPLRGLDISEKAYWDFDYVFYTDWGSNKGFIRSKSTVVDNMALSFGTLTSDIYYDPDFTPCYSDRISKLGWIYLVDDASLNSSGVSSELLTKDYHDGKDKYGEDAFLFPSVDEGRTYGENVVRVDYDGKDLLAGGKGSLGDSMSGFEEWWWNLTNKKADDFKMNWSELIVPIVVIDEPIASTLKTICEEYYISSIDDAADFRDYVNAAVAKGESVVLMRYAATSYYAEYVETTPAIEGKAYIAQETVFLDFDVIQLTFEQDGQLYAYGVVSDPKDVISGIDPPNTEDGPPSLPKPDYTWLKILFVALLGVAIFAGGFVIYEKLQARQMARDIRSIKNSNHYNNRWR